MEQKTEAWLNLMLKCAELFPVNKAVAFYLADQMIKQNYDISKVMTMTGKGNVTLSVPVDGDDVSHALSFLMREK